MTPRLTYIIPAYNAETTVCQTVRSVLRQSERHVRALVVDDGSTDGTRHVVGGMLGPRVGLLSQENRGLAGARNTGWRAAETVHVCFLDADDVVAPDHASTMLEAIGSTDAVACACEHVGPTLESLDWIAPVLPDDTGHERLLQANRLTVGAVVLRRDVTDRLLGGRMFDESLPVIEDWDLWLRMAAAGARWATPVHEALFRYRLTTDSMSMGLDRMRSAGIRVLERHARNDAERSSALRGWTLRTLARAVAVQDGASASQILEEIGTLTPADEITLLGALRWALARQDIAGPHSWPERAGEWRDRLCATLGSQPLAQRLNSRLIEGSGRWDRALARAAKMLTPGDRVVIYGFGRNGREAVSAARSARLPFVVMDDNTQTVAAGKGMPTTTLDDLGIGSVVLVTPDDHARMLAKLHAVGVRRIILPHDADESVAA